MKGIVLAGGLGTRLFPLTKITNKHLLPIYNKPMIYYAIQTLVNSGINDIMVVIGGNHAGDFLKLLRNGEEFGLKRLQYTYQEKEGGIGEALALCEDFVGNNNVLVMLGDNIVEENFKTKVIEFDTTGTAHVFLKEVDNPHEYGVAEFDHTNKNIIGIAEKPQQPKSNFIVTGIYMYDPQVFDFLKNLKYSERSELEITDINNVYLELDSLAHSILSGYWIDAGESILAYNSAIQFMKNKAQNE